jgi:hypothetical protein
VHRLLCTCATTAFRITQVCPVTPGCIQSLLTGLAPPPAVVTCVSPSSFPPPSSESSAPTTQFVDADLISGSTSSSTNNTANGAGADPRASSNSSSHGSSGDGSASPGSFQATTPAVAAPSRALISGATDTPTTSISGALLRPVRLLQQSSADPPDSRVFSTRKPGAQVTASLDSGTGVPAVQVTSQSLAPSSFDPSGYDQCTVNIVDTNIVGNRASIAAAAG